LHNCLDFGSSKGQIFILINRLSRKPQANTEQGVQGHYTVSGAPKAPQPNTETELPALNSLAFAADWFAADPEI
jgi:hypothetical protein